MSTRATATPPSPRPLGVALSAQLIELAGSAPRELRLLPAGSFRAKDGRPQGLPGWHLDFLGARALIDAASRQTDRFLIDYDHQTLNAKTNGQKAPAAGWFSALAWKEGDAAPQGPGLYATDVEWTEPAAAAIAAREYRYLSPVLTYDPDTGAVTGLLMAALVNYPALDGLTDLAAAHFLIPSRHEGRSYHPNEALSMDDLLERLRYLLNLPLTATATDIAAELDKVKTMITGADGESLGLAAVLQRHETETAALAAKLADAPDPARYAPIAALSALQTELATLRQQAREAELSALLEPALADGRLLPGQKGWAEALGRKDIESLHTYLATTQPLAALSGLQTGGKAPDGPEAVKPIKTPPGLSVDPDGIALHAKIEAYAQQHGVDYTTAALAVGNL